MLQQPYWRAFLRNSFLLLIAFLAGEYTNKKLTI